MKEKKMSLQEWSMHYRQIIILLVSCLVALGIYGLANINKNEFPDFTIRQGIGEEQRDTYQQIENLLHVRL